MSLWSSFTKYLYSNSSMQLEVGARVLTFFVHELFTVRTVAEAVAERVWIAWDEYAHKKAAMLGAFLFAWNFTAASTRLFGGEKSISRRLMESS